MDSFEEKVQKFINRHRLIDKNEHILVGVSGGPDSLALLHYLNTIREEWHLKLTVATVDHMFRGEQSYQEMLYVKSLCSKWNIPFEGTRINIPKEKGKHQESSQALSRKLRYQFFQSVMKKYQIQSLALAHHGDDQIETILMRMTRGTSIKGAAGIQAKRSFGDGYIIRPFLSVTRDEIDTYIQTHKLIPKYDPSNDEDHYTRNRYRKYVVPFLKKENSQVHIHFQRFSEELLQDEEYLLSQAKNLFDKVVTFEKSNQISMSISHFVNEPLPLQRRCIHLILNYLYQGLFPTSLSALHINAILNLIKNIHPSGMVNLPDGLTVYRSYSIVKFGFQLSKGKGYSFEWNQGENLLLPNGSELMMTGSVHDCQGNNGFILSKDVKLPLIVRTRQDGDRIQVKGMNGTKKVKSIFIEQKIPIHERDEWPIVTDSEGEILWIPGLKKSKHESNELNKGDILLKYKRKDF